MCGRPRSGQSVAQVSLFLEAEWHFRCKHLHAMPGCQRPSFTLYRSPSHTQTSKLLHFPLLLHFLPNSCTFCTWGMEAEDTENCCGDPLKKEQTPRRKRIRRRRKRRRRLRKPRRRKLGQQQQSTKAKQTQQYYQTGVTGISPTGDTVKKIPVRQGGRVSE